jgi:NB-ARC domain/Tetratricopeptide repeat
MPVTLEEIAAEVVNWFSGQSRWLIVFDNLDDAAAIKGLLPASRDKGHTILTTRNWHTAHIPADGLEIPMMAEEEALELFLMTAECGRDATIREEKNIVQELGCLPLALDQAGAFARSSKISEFLEISRTSRKRFLTDKPVGNHPYENSIHSTWKISFDRLPGNAKELVELLAYLNADEILVEFLLETSSELDASLREVISDRFSFAKAITSLQTYSFVKLWDDGRKISIHRLVQTVIRENIPTDRRKKRQSEVLMMCNRGFRYSIFNIHNATARLKFRTLLAQVTAPIVHFDADVYKLFILGPVADSITDFLFDEAQYKQCEVLAKKMAEYRQKEFGLDDPRTLAAQRGLAAIYCAEDNPSTAATALALYEETFTRQVQILGRAHPETLWTAHGLGVALDGARRPYEAIQLLEATCETRGRVLGKTHMHTLRSKHFLALLYEMRQPYSRRHSLRGEINWAMMTPTPSEVN